MKKLYTNLVALLFVATSIQAAEKSPVRIELHSYQQIMLKDKQGKLKKDKEGHVIKKWVPVKRVVPNTVVKYVDTIINDSNETLTDVKVKNRINPNLAYIADSAASKAEFSVKYSVDGGRHFDLPENLYVVENKRKRLAKPSEYNAILFVVNKVPAHTNVDVSYKTILK